MIYVMNSYKIYWAIYKWVWGMFISCLCGGPNYHPHLHQVATPQVHLYKIDLFVSMSRQALAVSLQILGSLII